MDRVSIHPVVPRIGCCAAFRVVAVAGAEPRSDPQHGGLCAPIEGAVAVGEEAAWDVWWDFLRSVDQGDMFLGIN
jgi:hypothetical protein